MTAAGLLEKLRSAGLQVAANGEALVIRPRDLLTDELRADGDVNDLLRMIQQSRKDKGLQVSDRIDLTLGISDELWAAVQSRIELVKAETLSLSVTRTASEDGEIAVTVRAVSSGQVSMVAASQQANDETFR